VSEVVCAVGKDVSEGVSVCLRVYNGDVDVKGHTSGLTVGADAGSGACGDGASAGAGTTESDVMVFELTFEGGRSFGLMSMMYIPSLRVSLTM